MTFDECRESLKNVMDDEDGYLIYTKHHLLTIWNAAIDATEEVIRNEMVDYNNFTGEHTLIAIRTLREMKV